jgi:predicted transcriptional regulator
VGKSTKERLLTEVELELMNIIWRFEKCVVRDVLNALPEGRDVIYTSVAKIMKILEDKGVLRSEKSEKTHLYFAVLTRDEYEKRTLKHVADKLFEGSPSSMVMRLLDESELSEEELKRIQKSLRERMRT